MKECAHTCELSVTQPINRSDKIRTVNRTCPHSSPSAEPGRKLTGACELANVDCLSEARLGRMAV